MKRTGTAIGFLVFLLTGVALAVAQEPGSPLARASAARLREGLSPSFVAALDRSLAGLLAQARISARALDIVLESTRGEWLPAEPAEAALVLSQAAHDADDAVRRGIPAQVIKAQLRQELQALQDGNRELTLRREIRDGRGPGETSRGSGRSEGGPAGAGGGGQPDHGGNR